MVPLDAFVSVYAAFIYAYSSLRIIFRITRTASSFSAVSGASDLAMFEIKFPKHV